MPTLIFIEANGTEHSMSIATGMNVMQAAVSRGIPGIDGDCGGSCSCSTCHVYVDPAWIDTIGHAKGREEDILDFAKNVRESSRLSCQIWVEEEFNGARFHIPIWQR